MSEPTDTVHGSKHIARLEKRAAALEARMSASPLQADFSDEAAEVKSIRWVIKELNRHRSQPSDDKRNARRYREIQSRGYPCFENGYWVFRVGQAVDYFVDNLPASLRDKLLAAGGAA